MLENYPSNIAAGVVRGLTFPFGIPLRKPSDRLLAQVADVVQTPGETRDRLLADSYIPRPEIDKLAYGELGLRLLPQVELIDARLKPAIKQGLIEPLPISTTAFTAWRVKARALDLISDDEEALLARYVEYADHAIQVDDLRAGLRVAGSLAATQTSARNRRPSGVPARARNASVN